MVGYLIRSIVVIVFGISQGSVAVPATSKGLRKHLCKERYYTTAHASLHATYVYSPHSPLFKAICSIRGLEIVGANGL